MDDYDVQFMSSLSPKIDLKKKTKSKGPTVLSLKKHFRKSLLVDKTRYIDSNISTSIIEISSSDSACSYNCDKLNSCSKIIIDESDAEINNALDSSISLTSNSKSDDEEIISPSPNRKNIIYECVSTSKKNVLNKVRNKDLPRSKFSQIMTWMKDVDECNDALEKKEIHSQASVEGSLLSYDEFEEKRKIDAYQVLNSTMLPNPIKNSYYTDYTFNNNVFSESRQNDVKKLKNKLDSTNDEAVDFNKSCEDLLDELYGTSWRMKRDEVLSKSERKNRKKIVIEKETFSKSERKPKESNCSSKKLNQNNLLKTLQRVRVQKKIDFPSMEELCDEKLYNDNENFKTFTKEKLNCDLLNKGSQVQGTKLSAEKIKSFETTNCKQFDKEDNLNFSDKENVSHGEMSFLDHKEMECEVLNVKVKENANVKKKKVIPREGRQDTKTMSVHDKLIQKTIPNKKSDRVYNILPDRMNISCHMKDDGEKCKNVGKSRKKRMQQSETDYIPDKFSFESLEELEINNSSEGNRYSFLASLSKNIPDSQCNMLAKIFRNNFKQHKEHLAKGLFDLYNKKIFDNAIPDTTVIEWNSRMSSTAGFCCSKKITHRNGDVERVSKIVLSSKVLDSADRLRDTLIHEMCHAATWVVNQVSNGHGEYWMAWTKKAKQIFPELPPIKRCHNYKVNTKYIYRCTVCGYSIGRHKKSFDIEQKRCGYCLGKFEILINKINKKGEQRTVPATPKREPTGFALFVKDNYTRFKEPGINHGSVMKLLSQKFNEMKV